jgi:5'-3' exoribonuclease 1
MSGTPFMAKLSEQLRYFVNKKITEDANWREVQVVLSGHEVPGEGEHKIMEYIRLSKAQPDYNPNVRHCLYGLDADLIMLGLLSHDPHFCLLREEVKFGPASKKRNNSTCVCTCYFLCYWLTVDCDMEGWSRLISTCCICRSCASTWISSSGT